MNGVESNLILKNLNAVLTYASERYKNEFLWQEFRLNDTFKNAYCKYLKNKGWDVEYFDVTTVVTSSKNQYIFIANQWFAMASYYVDFCTELLTYQEYFMKVCSRLGIYGKKKTEYATRLKTLPSADDKRQFITTAYNILKRDFPDHSDCETVAGYLWCFVSDYSWWSGSKTVERNDFFISPILNNLQVVNANSEYLAEIANCYASNYQLRRLVEDIDSFMVGARKKNYTPTQVETESYLASEANADIKIPAQELRKSVGISISAASLERFHQNT